MLPRTLAAAALVGHAALVPARPAAPERMRDAGPGPSSRRLVVASPRGDDGPVVVIAAGVRDSMNAVFERSTRDWRRYPNTVNAMNYGAGSAGWQEALRCLRGTVAADTVWVRGWAAARGTRALANAVTGDCSGVADLVGSWHTHPWRASSTGQPVKVPGLSTGDLRTFRVGREAVAIVQWSGDSLAAAVRAADGAVRYPALVVPTVSPAR